MKAIAYCRFSSDGQRDESIEAQIRAIQDYAQKNNMEIIKIYADKAESATTDNRTEFQNMFRFIENNTLDIKYLIVHKLDRFARNKYDSAMYKRKLKLKEIKLVSVLERLDDSPESVILESVLEGMAEYYSLNLARETMKGMKENAYKAKFNGGISPYGYSIDNDNNYVIDESESSTVKFIFDNYFSGQGYKTIISELIKRGVKTRSGKDFSQGIIYSILKNEKYCGIYSFNKTHNIKGENGKKVFRKNSAETIIKVPNAIPAIISQDMFEKIQIKLNENKRVSQAFKAKRVYLLSGKLYCSECGAAMCGSTRKGGKDGSYIYTSYYCPNRKRKTCTCKEYKAETIEESILDYIQDVIFSESNINSMLKDINEKIKKMQSEQTSNIEIFEKELSKVKLQINSIIEAIKDGLYNPSMKDTMNELESKKNELILLIEDEKNHNLSFTSDMISDYISMGKKIKSLDPDKQKSFIKSFIKKIVAHKDNHLEIQARFYEFTLSSGNPIEYVVSYLLDLY